MDHYATGSEKTETLKKQRRRHNLISSAVLFLFLLLSCSLVFGIANLGVQRRIDPWLPGVAYQGEADYSVDDQLGPNLPRIREGVIEDVQRDAAIDAASSPTATLTTPSSSPGGDLIVEAGGPYTGREGSRIRLEARVRSLLGLVPGSVTYRWDTDEDGRYDDETGRVISVLFFDEGLYRPAVQATDLLGRVATDTAVVNVRNAPPVVDIGDDIVAAEAEPVLFEARAADPGQDILFYEWDFGDGTVADLDTLSPEHTYADNGDYLVTLRVRDNDNAVNQDTLLVTVLNQPPLVNAGPDRQVEEGETIILRGTATDPAGDLDPLIYSWDLNYDGVNFVIDALGPVVTSRYINGPATQVAALRVEDDDGGQAIDTVAIRVANKEPVITRIGSTAPAAEGSAVEVRVTALDPGNDTLTYAYDWGDGSTSTNQPATASHTWRDDGVYLVEVQADDGQEGRVAATVAISIYNVAPTAIVNLPPGPFFEGTTLSFNAGDSTDPGADTLTYEWNFGAGNIVNGVNAFHTYPDSGFYTGTLKVSDDDGGVDVNFFNILVFNTNPVINAGGDRVVNEGETFIFTGSATDAGVLDDLMYAWDFSYDRTIFNVEGTGLSTGHRYPDGGAGGSTRYTGALRVRDDDYNEVISLPNQVGESIDTFQVIVRNVPPANATIKAAPNPVVELEPVTLTGEATDVPADLPLLYKWQIQTNSGDSDVLREQTVNYTWSKAGTYRVDLRVSDKDGGAITTTQMITVTNAPPIAEAGGPYSGREDNPLAPSPSRVIFDAGGSRDPSTPPDQLTYTWDFGDGSPLVTTTNLTVSHIYTDDPPGPVDDYTAKLTVVDDKGGRDTDTATVTIANQNPTVASVQFTPRPAPEGTDVIFIGVGGDPSPADNKLDKLSLRWSFGDGSFANSSSTSPVKHAYRDDSGSPYIVQLTVRDKDGGRVTQNIPITVTNVAPTAVISPMAPLTATEGLTFTFDSSLSSDPGVLDVLEYSWDFGDGTPPTTTTNITLPHAFPNEGFYTVTLTVDDNDGGIATDTITVTVRNSAPTVTAGGPYTTTVGLTVPLTAAGNDVFVNRPLTYTWDLDNDGLFDEGLGATTTFTQVAGPGVYTVSVRVVNKDGEAATEATTVTVNSVLPIALLAGIPYYYYLVKRRWQARRRRRKRRPGRGRLHFK